MMTTMWVWKPITSPIWKWIPLYIYSNPVLFCVVCSNIGWTAFVASTQLAASTCADSSLAITTNFYTYFVTNCRCTLSDRSMFQLLCKAQCRMKEVYLQATSRHTTVPSWLTSSPSCWPDVTTEVLWASPSAYKGRGSIPVCISIYVNINLSFKPF